MSSMFLKSGKTFKVTTKEALDIHPVLPNGTYTVGFNSCSGQYFLEIIDPFEINGKLYGDTQRRADRILRTFKSRERSTGVLLTGEKGSGKTMLAKKISIQASEMDVPTIVVNQPWHGETFNTFIQMIEQPAIVIFDEFEKVYSETEAQQALLTLLDGVYTSKKLFLLTCNDKWRLDTNMHNRPGRIFYSLEYKGLALEFIREYCEDNLENKDHIDMVCSTSKVFARFNFDMLKALVEEMNRYGETPAEALEFLNARPAFDNSVTYKIRLFVKGKKVKSSSNTWCGVPMNEDINLYYGDNYKEVTFNSGDFLKMDPRTGAYIFEKKSSSKKSQRLILIPSKEIPTVNFSMVQKMETKPTEESLTASESEDESDSDNDSGDESSVESDPTEDCDKEAKEEEEYNAAEGTEENNAENNTGENLKVEEDKKSES